MHYAITEEIQAQVNLNDNGQACIVFSDPAYVRSEVIIFDRSDSSLHAVLHEKAHRIGRIGGELSRAFAEKSEITLSAPHYFSGTLSLTTTLAVK